jgi:hypothetical protein
MDASCVSQVPTRPIKQRLRLGDNVTQSNLENNQVFGVDTSSSWELEQHYTVENLRQVNDFLGAHPFLVPLLAEAHGEILRYFPDAALTLELIEDPELDRPQLYLVIRAPLDADTTWERYQQFWQGWWRDNYRRSALKLIIDIVYEL